jgi:hypothetical protein
LVLFWKEVFVIRTGPYIQKRWAIHGGRTGKAQEPKTKDGGSITSASAFP